MEGQILQQIEFPRFLKYYFSLSKGLPLTPSPQNREREQRRDQTKDYHWNAETRETSIRLTEARPGIFSGKFLLPFGIYKYRYRTGEARERERERVRKIFTPCARIFGSFIRQLWNNRGSKLYRLAIARRKSLRVLASSQYPSGSMIKMQIKYPQR